MRKPICAVALIVGVVIPTISSPKDSFLPLYQAGRGALVLDLSIGEETDDGDALLFEPTDLCVDADGKIFVLDPRMPCVKVFDPEGNHVLTINSVGEGPGDISMPTEIALGRDGAIAVYDISNRRFSFFGADGEFLDSASYQEIVWGFDITPSGHVYVETRLADFQGTRGGSRIRLLQYSSGFSNETVVDSALIKTDIYITKPLHTNVIVPYPPKLLWAVAPTGNLVVARSKDYTIKIISPELETLREVKHHGNRIKIDNQDKENHFAGITTMVDGVISKGAPQYIREATEFPEYKPYFKSMVIDHEGYILTQTYEVSGDNVIYDVFSPNLEFVNHVTLPELGPRCVMAKGYVYQLHRPDDESASVRRYRLQRAEAARKAR